MGLAKLELFVHSNQAPFWTCGEHNLILMASFRVPLLLVTLIAVLTSAIVRVFMENSFLETTDNVLYTCNWIIHVPTH